MYFSVLTVAIPDTLSVPPACTDMSGTSRGAVNCVAVATLTRTCANAAIKSKDQSIAGYGHITGDTDLNLASVGYCCLRYRWLIIQQPEVSKDSGHHERIVHREIA